MDMPTHGTTGTAQPFGVTREVPPCGGRWIKHVHVASEDSMWIIRISHVRMVKSVKLETHNMAMFHSSVKLPVTPVCRVLHGTTIIHEVGDL